MFIDAAVFQIAICGLDLGPPAPKGRFPAAVSVVCL